MWTWPKLAKSGRNYTFTIELSDKPGQLAGVMDIIAGQGGASWEEPVGLKLCNRVQRAVGELCPERRAHPYRSLEG